MGALWWPCSEAQRRRDFITLMTWVMSVDAKLDEIIDRLDHEEDDDDT
jgi:hypothetical protein